MKRGTAAAVVIGGAAAVLVGVGAVAHATSAKQQQGGTVQVRVTVTDQSTGSPVAVAGVQLGALVQATDYSGKASFNVAPGPYTLAVVAQGYETFTESVQVLSAESIPVSLAPAPPPPPPSCDQLIPAALFPATTHRVVNLAWMVSVDWLNNVTKYGIIPSNPTSCPGSMCSAADFSQDTWEFDMSGQVVDSADAPVCKVTVKGTIDSSLDWKTGDGLAGTIRFSIPGSAVTDNNGNFTLKVYAALTVTQGNASFFTNAAGEGGGTAFSPSGGALVAAFTYQVEGTVIAYPVGVTLALLVCSVNLISGC